MNKNEVITLSHTDAERAVTKIQKAVAKIESTASKGYISIAGDVAKLADAKSFTEFGYKNISDMCKDLFAMSKSTTYNLLAINKRFFDNYRIMESAEELTIREMLAVIADEKREALEDKSEALKDKSEEVVDEKREEVIDVYEYSWDELCALHEPIAKAIANEFTVPCAVKLALIRELK